MFVIRRLSMSLVVLILVLVFVLGAVSLLPGDAATAILGQEATPEKLAAMREQLRLNEPVWQRYLSYMGDLLRGRLGNSFVSGLPVSTVLGESVARSAVLVAAAAVISTPLALAIGIWSAVKRNGIVDHTLSIGNLVLVAFPEFVIGILLVYLFATGPLQVLPAVATVDSTRPITEQANLLALPVLTLVLGVVPYISRIVRATMLEVLDSEYVQFARLKGVPMRRIVLTHAFPNVLGPVSQVIALQLALLASGVVVVEYLFSYPGIGTALVHAVATRDIPVVQALVLLIALLYVVLNLLADLIGMISNPRLRGAR